MENYDNDDWSEGPSAMVTYGKSPMNMVQQVTTKIPPSFDGTSSWFAYEEAIEDWCDITELEPEKRGPALRNRLEGDAAVYRPLLDRDLLRDAITGVKYFKDNLRPHFYQKQSISISLAIPPAIQGSSRFARYAQMDRKIFSAQEKIGRIMDGSMEANSTR